MRSTFSKVANNLLDSYGTFVVEDNRLVMCKCLVSGDEDCDAYYRKDWTEVN